MKIQHIRNATLVVEFADKKFLIDPMMGKKGAYPPMPNPSPEAPKGNQNFPLDSLPTTVDEIIDVDEIILTHTHPDHWDQAAIEILPKEIRIYVQHDGDAEKLKNDGFENIEILTEDTMSEDIQLVKTKGQHGRGAILETAGEVCGVVFKHPNEKILYVAGDTVWYEGIQEEIDTHIPEVIVVNAGDNQFAQGGSLVMNEDDVYEVSKAAPDATLIAVHMESANHYTLSKEELRNFAEEQGFDAQIYVPDNGETFEF